MADLRDFTKKNPIFTGTDGIRLSNTISSLFLSKMIIIKSVSELFLYNI
jgi:hypothetical protein